MAGPRTKDSGAVRIGLMQIRVDTASDHIGETSPQLSASDSIGALARTKYMGSVDWWDLETGYPMLLDAKFPIRESASLEGDMMEITPANMAFAHGLDGTLPAYATEYSGEIALGARIAPVDLRVEAKGVFPDGTKEINFIFPKAIITSSAELEDQKEEGASMPIVITATPADGSVTNGNAVWNAMPLGRIFFTPDTTD